jgi:hypothetical protein
MRGLSRPQRLLLERLTRVHPEARAVELASDRRLFDAAAHRDLEYGWHRDDNTAWRTRLGRVLALRRKLGFEDFPEARYYGSRALPRRLAVRVRVNLEDENRFLECRVEDNSDKRLVLSDFPIPQVEALGARTSVFFTDVTGLRMFFDTEVADVEEGQGRALLSHNLFAHRLNRRRDPRVSADRSIRYRKEREAEDAARPAHLVDLSTDGASLHQPSDVVVGERIVLLLPVAELTPERSGGPEAEAPLALPTLVLNARLEQGRPVIGLAFRDLTDTAKPRLDEIVGALGER